MTKNLMTLSGVPVSEITVRLAEPFNDPKAYKAVPGGADLTDINTGYMLERVNEVFGPKGLGWNLLFSKEDLQIFGDPTASKRLTVRLAYAVFQYTLVDGEGQRHTFDIPTSGTNTNDFTYAEEGARTSALGAALKGMGFQAPIYKGLLDHHNASRLLQTGHEAGAPKPDRTAAALPAGGNGHKSSPGSGNGRTARKPDPDQAKALVKPEPPSADQDLDDLDAPEAREVNPEAPGDFVIPIGKNAGKRLSEASLTWVQWAAKDLQATTEQTLALQAAARAFLEQQVKA